MRRNVIETVLGAVVLVGAILFLAFAYKTADVKKTEGYALLAPFNKIDGINLGADVSLNGIKVGNVSAMKLDEHYRAVLTLSIDNNIKLPQDTAAVITSSGLLGEKFISLQPGADEQMMAANDTFTYTESPPGLEQLLGQVIFSMNKSAQAAPAAAESAATPTAPVPATPAPAAAVPH